MAVTRSKKDSLVETKIVDSTSGGDDTVTSKTPIQETPTPKAAVKKRGFLATTIEELRKVNWPGARYVLNWSLVIILFTTIFSVSLGVIDNVFNSGLKFVDCTSIITTTEDSSSVNSGEILGDCSRDFLQDITYRG